MTAAVRRWARSLQPEALFSIPVMAGTAAEFCLVQLASPYNTRADLVLVLLQVVAVGLAFLALGVIYLALRRLVAVTTMRVVLLVSIPLVASGAGLFLQWARLAMGLDETPLWLLRTTNTAMHVTAISVLLWLAISNIRLHYARLDVLTEDLDRLQALDQQANRSLLDLDDRITEVVRARILKGLRTEDPSRAEPVLVALRSTLEQTVRPLSRQLESQSEVWEPPDPAPRVQQRIDWRAAAAGGLNPALFSPLGVIIILNLIGLPMNLARVGPAFAAEFIVLSALVVWPAFVLIRRATIAVAGTGAHGVIRLAVFVLMCVLSGLALGLATLPLTLGGPQPFRFVYLAPIFTPIIAFIWGFAVAAQRQARDAEATLEAVAADLQWRLARARELHRQQRRALTHAVHGNVQAALAAGILELEQALATGTVSEDRTRVIQSRIAECVRDLDLRSVRPSPLLEVTNKVRATWAGIVDLSLTCDSRVLALVEADRQCLMTLNDVIPELVFNSVKHGRARHVDVALVQRDVRAVELTVVDDGYAPAAQGLGLGSRLLDDCSLAWSRTSSDGRTLTMLLLPVSACEVAIGGEFKGFPLDSNGLAHTPA